MTPNEAVSVLVKRGLAARVMKGEERILGGRDGGMAGGVPIYLDSFAIDATENGWACRFAGGVHDEERAARSLAEAVDIVMDVLRSRESPEAARAARIISDGPGRQAS